MPNVSLRRLPPYSEEAERTTLGTILYEPETIRICTKKDITPNHFYIPAHRLIFEAMQDLQTKGRPTDILLVAERLRDKGQLDAVGGSLALDRMVDMHLTVAHFDHYLEEVTKHWKRRGIIHCGREAEEKAYNSDETEDEIISALKQSLSKIEFSKNGHKTIPESVRTLRDIYTKARNSGTGRGIESRFWDFQQKTTGYKPSQQTFIAGRPSEGKTTFALNEILNISTKHGLPSLIVSIEMDQDRIVSRLIGDLMSLNMQKFESGKPTQDEVSRFNEGGKIIQELPIYIVAGNITPEKYDSVVKEHVERYGVVFVMMDHIQIMSPSKIQKFPNRNLEVAYMSRIIMGLGNDTKVHQMIISHMSRVKPAYGKTAVREPVLDDLRDSGALEQDADVVGFMYQNPDKKVSHTDDADASILKIAKNRDGPKGDIDLTFQKTMQRFVGMDNASIENKLIDEWVKKIDDNIDDSEVPF